MLQWSSRVKSALIVNIAYFPHPFCQNMQNMSTYLDKAKKKIKILKIEILTKPPKSGHENFD